MKRLILGWAMAAAAATAGRAAEPIPIEAKRKPSDKAWTTHPTWTVRHLNGCALRAEPPETGRYGGLASQTLEATGFFRTQKIGDRWWLVDPEGHPFLHVGVCSVAPRRGSDRAKEAFAARFGTETAWAEATAAQLSAHGFTGTGAWSADALLAAAPRRLAYCPIWNFMSAYGKKRGGTFQKPGHTGYPGNAIFVFDPGFEAFAAEHARSLAALKDDPWLLGHFTDNELPLYKRTLDGFLGLPEDDPGRRAADDWLRKRKGAAADPKRIDDADREAFRELVIDRYFAIVAKAIRAADPHHLILGSRFHGDEKNSPGAFRAAGRHCDVVSVNLYGAWTPDPALLANWVGWSGKPFLISEFYAKGEDSGLANTTGAGWLVKTQRDRGLFYQNFTLALLASKGCVGWHHFKYADNDPDDLSTDPSNRDANKGIVNARFEPYPAFLEQMRELNFNAAGIASWIDAGGRVYPAEGR